MSTRRDTSAVAMAAAVLLMSCEGILGGSVEAGGGDGGTTPSGVGAAGSGGSSHQGAGGSAGAGATTSTGSGTTTGAGAGGSAGAAGSAGTGGGSIVSCPASAPVDLEAWTSSPWVAPSSGTAEVSFNLSQEVWLHYERFELDLDIDVTTPQEPYTCFLELRNVGGPKNEYFPWRYFAVCTRNDGQNRLIHIVFAADDGYLATPFTLQSNTSYHVNVLFDAAASISTLTLTEQGGLPVAITKTPLTSSIAPQGQGLRLLVGFNVNHPDYPTIKPPWGWTFRNLTVHMDPGGPWGVDAPACP